MKILITADRKILNTEVNLICKQMKYIFEKTQIQIPQIFQLES